MWRAARPRKKEPPRAAFLLGNDEMKNEWTTRKRILCYVADVLKITTAQGTDNRTLCRMIGLGNLSKNGAWKALREFSQSDAVERAVNARRARRRRVERITKDSFYESLEWKKLRYKVLKSYGGQCQCCGAKRADGAILHVDHIKPRSKFPELALTDSNLQVLF